MRHVVEQVYCDKCGGTELNKSTNVPYLGWVFIDTHPQGVMIASPVKIDLCPPCFYEVRDYIAGREGDWDR